MAKKNSAKTVEPPVETPTKEPEVTESTTSEPAAPAEKMRGPRGVADSAVIKLLVQTNPKREGSKARERFAHYVDGMTVGAALDAGVTTPDLVYDTKHGFIAIAGYDPGEIITPKPKEPKAPKEPKVKKTKEEKAADAAGEAEKLAEVEQTTAEEVVE